MSKTLQDIELVRRMDSTHVRISSEQHELLRLVAQADGMFDWTDWGARDAAHWLCMRYGISEWKARRWVEAAYALERLPLLSAAFASGKLGIDKVVELARFATVETESRLITWGRRVSCASIRRKGDLAVREAAEKMREVAQDRSVSWWFYDDDRRFRLEAELPGAEGAMVAKALGRLAETLPVMPGEESSLDARRADALVALADSRIAQDADPDRATIVVHADLEALVSDDVRCEIEGGPVIPAETARRLLCHSRFQTVLEGEGDRVLEVGRMSREPAAWMIRQLRHRDRGCTFPGCGTRRFAEAHHIVWWRNGGRTDLDNLALICSFHHRLVHEYGWTIRRDADGMIRWFDQRGSPHHAGPSPSREPSPRTGGPMVRAEEPFAWRPPGKVAV